MPAATREPAGDRGTADRIEADEGHYWLRLVTKQAMDREGRAMGHCVGNGGYDEHAGSEEMADNAIWSLRRPDGVSVLTTQIRYLELDYAKGPKNSAPGRFESLQVAHLVAGFKEAGHALKVDEDTGIVLLEDGRTFRADRLPPGVQAEIQERDARRRERRFPSVWGMRNARIEGGHLVVERNGETHRLIEVASHFTHNPEPVSDGPVDGFDLSDQVVTIRLPGGRRIHVPVSGDTRLVTRGEGYQPLPSSMHERVEFRSNENPLRPILETVTHRVPVHPAMQLTADEPDPIVECWHAFDTGLETFRTRSGIRFSAGRRFSLRAAGLSEILEAYRAAIARAEADRLPAQTTADADPVTFTTGRLQVGDAVVTSVTPDGFEARTEGEPHPIEQAPARHRVILQVATCVRAGDIVQLGLPSGEAARNVTHVEIRGYDGTALSPDEYALDPALGTVQFHRNSTHRSIEFRPGPRPWAYRPLRAPEQQPPQPG